MWLITFYCIGLYCNNGADLGWSTHFSSEKSCKEHGERLIASAILPAGMKAAGMKVTYTCSPE